MSSQAERLHAVFSGQVQGVGFRYTAKLAAGSYPDLTGMVRNLPDGAVELIAEGSKADIDGLIEDIKRVMHDNINDIQEQWSSGIRQYSSFIIGF